jgi:putative endonuclease
MTRSTRRAGRISGTYWEDRARRHLERHGLRTLHHGYRCRLGEIDLIMLDGDALVFVEVRARSTGSFATALETVDARKRAKLLRTARFFLMSYPCRAPATIRFDVVGIDAIDTDTPRLNWIRNAFGES